jgi:hypothetical protein
VTTEEALKFILLQLFVIVVPEPSNFDCTKDFKSISFLELNFINSMLYKFSLFFTISILSLKKVEQNKSSALRIFNLLLEKVYLKKD